MALLLGIVVPEDLELHALDVRTAFLSGNLEEEAWMEHPKVLCQRLRGQVKAQHVCLQTEAGPASMASQARCNSQGGGLRPRPRQPVHLLQRYPQGRDRRSLLCGQRAGCCANKRSREVGDVKRSVDDLRCGSPWLTCVGVSRASLVWMCLVWLAFVFVRPRLFAFRRPCCYACPSSLSVTR
jgi:hypothetical protein